MTDIESNPEQKRQQPQSTNKSQKAGLGLALGLGLILAVGFINSPSTSAGTSAGNLAPCGSVPPTEFILYAGQHIDSGVVSITNDATDLIVTFSTTGDWEIAETQLHVAGTLAGIPANRKGNPSIGHFEYKATHDPRVTEFTYTIPGALDLLEGETLVIAAHAVVVNSVTGSSETAWSNGDRFVDRGSWAMYSTYEWQQCDPQNPEGPTCEGSETAFAFKPVGSEIESTCFLDITEEESTFNRWGWTTQLSLGVENQFDVYAGAGQCDLSKGTYVGTVTAFYGAGSSTAYVTLSTDDWDTLEYHLYIGNEILPRNTNGDYTVAPGQYPLVVDMPENDNTNYIDYDVAPDLNPDAPIYIVLHATVCDPTLA